MRRFGGCIAAVVGFMAAVLTIVTFLYDFSVVDKIVSFFPADEVTEARERGQEATDHREGSDPDFEPEIEGNCGPDQDCAQKETGSLSHAGGPKDEARLPDRPISEDRQESAEVGTWSGALGDLPAADRCKDDAQSVALAEQRLARALVEMAPATGGVPRITRRGESVLAGKQVHLLYTGEGIQQTAVLSLRFRQLGMEVSHEAAGCGTSQMFERRIGYHWMDLQAAQALQGAVLDIARFSLERDDGLQVITAWIE